MTQSSPNHQCVFLIAQAQHGYFTAKQARTCGFDSSDLSYHARTGKYLRVRRGIYRLRDYPPFYREHLMVPLLETGIDDAVVSHQSALDLLELSDVIPAETHLTIPRAMRYRRNRPGVIIHTTTRQLGPHETTIREGIRITAPEVTIADAAEIGVGPEQIEMAVWQALDRGITTERQLRREARIHSQRVRDLIEQSIDGYSK